MRIFLVICCFLSFLLTAEEEFPPVALAVVPIAKVPLPVVPIAQVPLPEIKVAEVQTVVWLRPESRQEVCEPGVMPTPADTSAPTGGVDVVKVPVKVLAGVDEQLAAAKKIIALKKQQFRDQRAFEYDLSTTAGNAAFAEWLKIFEAHVPYTAVHIPLEKGIRMIAEVNCRNDPVILESNLAFYKGKGYNSALITFDGSENSWDLAALADKVAAAGFRCWYAFGGAEDLTLSVFVSPEKMRQLIRVIAPRCAGMLLNWRRTSQHLFLQDRAFTDFLIRSGREANARLQIVGEGYYGHTAANDGMTVSTNLPANSSGVLLVNTGYVFYNPKKVFERLFSHLGETPKLVHIIGPRPYYCSKGTPISFDEALKIKRSTEERFLAAGAAGTITLHGDGSGYTDNIGISTTGKELAE